MFRSQLLSMLVFAFVVSVLLAVLKLESPRAIVRQSAHNFLSLAGGAVVLSWLVRLL